MKVYYFMLEDPFIFLFFNNKISCSGIFGKVKNISSRFSHLQLETFSQRDFIQNYIFQRTEKTTSIKWGRLGSEFILCPHPS